MQGTVCTHLLVLRDLCPDSHSWTHDCSVHLVWPDFWPSGWFSLMMMGQLSTPHISRLPDSAAPLFQLEAPGRSQVLRVTSCFHAHAQRVAEELCSSCLLQESSEIDPCGTISSSPSAYELSSCCFYFSVVIMCPSFQVFAFRSLCALSCVYFIFSSPRSGGFGPLSET